MHVANFLSYKEVEFDFTKAGLVLVEGKNGSGKSAVCEALIWCLFGSTLRGYANDEVIHRKVGEDCLVQVFMEDDDTRYVVQRARRHSKFKNSLRVTSEGVDISGPGVAETQVVVERLLGCSMRTFLSSVVFGQDRAYRFSSLTDKEQKEILDEMLGVERFASACSVARERASLVQAALDVAERDHEKAEEARDAWDATVEDLRKKDRGYEKSRAEKVEEEREKLKKAREWVKENGKVDAGVTKTKVVRMAEAIAAADKHAAEMADGNTKAQVMLASARSKVEDLRKHVKRHEGLGGDCPTCGQKVLAKQQESILEDLQVRLVDANKAMAKVEAAAKEIEQGVVDARKSVKNLREKAVEVQKAHAEAVGAEANLASWRRRVEDHERRISELKEEANPFAALVANAEKRVSKHTKEVELLAKLVEEETARKKLADFWVAAFGARGLRSLLLDGSLPLLNAEASKLSRAITGGAISIEFSATSELKSGKTIDRFDVRVDNKHGAGSYQGNSAGERAKVDLCVGLALQRLVASRSPASFNIAVFDEAFDALDQSSHERVMGVMSENRQGGRPDHQPQRRSPGVGPGGVVGLEEERDLEGHDVTPREEAIRRMRAAYSASTRTEPTTTPDPWSFPVTGPWSYRSTCEHHRFQKLDKNWKQCARCWWCKPRLGVPPKIEKLPEQYVSGGGVMLAGAAIHCRCGPPCAA